MTSPWTTDQIPDQSGRTAIVTGANSGIGLETALELARAGATVLLACRNLEKGEAAADQIREAVPGAQAEVLELDVSSLKSVRQFADGLDVDGLDLLVNNAGVMAIPKRHVTEDGFEMQFGTNHLGHFALTGLLLNRLNKAEAPRVVTVASNEHKAGHFDFDDLQLEHGYGPRKAYRQTKLANTAFALELDRRVRAAGWSIKSVLAHPGYTATNLQSTAGGVMRLGMAIGNRLIAQSAERGALPTLYAATAPDVEGGEYYGPDGLGEWRGHPKLVQVKAEGWDEENRRRLWSVSEELTGVTYDFTGTS